MSALNTCACCGQSLRLDGRPIVKVDDALLALCNEAYASAEARMCAEVQIADLAWCIARSPRWAADIGAAGWSPQAMARSAEQAMSRPLSRGRTSGPVVTSHDLKSLLQRAERRALEAGRPAADVRDLLHVLAREAGDLVCADFLRRGFAATSRFETGERQWADHEAQRSPAYGRRPDEDASGLREHLFAPPHEARSPSRPNADIEAISARLAAQERHAAELARRNDQLAGHMQSLASRLAERSGTEGALRSELSSLARRLETQDRQIAELQRLVDAQAHQSAMAATRLAQAADLGRAQAEMLAELERRLREGEREPSGRNQRSTARSRLRRSRRRWLRLGLRRGRRMGSQSRRAWGWRDRSRTARQAQFSRPAVSTAHAPPLATHQALATERIDAYPRPYLESTQPRLDAAARPFDFDEEIAEPIEEDEDDLELEGVLGERPKRFYLALDDEIERAPSIGPRTAGRLTAAGVATVRDLLTCNPRDVAPRVQSRYVTAERLAAWKSQARLVCTVPWLRGTHAQLLVGAGYDTLDKLQSASTSDVCAGILRFSGTREGQSVLRSGPPPAPERIAKWMGHVTLAEPDRARLAA